MGELSLRCKSAPCGSSSTRLRIRACTPGSSRLSTQIALHKAPLKVPAIGTAIGDYLVRFGPDQTSFQVLQIKIEPRARVVETR